MKIRFRALPLALALLLFTTACGSPSEPPADQEPPQSTTSTQEPSSAPKEATPSADESSAAEDALVLGPGTYAVGEDIDAGEYDCVAVSGFGVFRGEVASLGEPGLAQTMGVESSVMECSQSYSNLTLADGDTLYIEMSLEVQFNAK